MSALRKTWGQVKDFVGIPIGMCASNPSLLPLVNEASEILWNEGDWVGKIGRYKLRVSRDCRGNHFITWPAQIETIEALTNCQTPIAVHNIYAEFISNGWGNLDTANSNAGYTGYSLY